MMQTVLTVLRWIFGAGLFVTVVLVMGRLPSAGVSVGSIALAAVAVALICLSALVFFPEARRLLMAPFDKLVEMIYLPGGKLDKPTLSYNLPRYYRRSRRFSRALERYELILEHYPEEEQAWRETIELLAVDLEDWAAAEHRKNQALLQFPKNSAAHKALLASWKQLQKQRPASVKASKRRRSPPRRRAR